ncbi:MAG: ATP-binding protein [Gammaproteobacteria bacterium]|nr:ATP-binding protein [Gammaproteobacteria bacterium]
MKPAGTYGLLVIDTGEGIRNRDLARVVEPFFSTKSASQGTGLGLSMVYGFVRQSGGAFRIDSTVGEGTRVELFFPACSAPDD